MRFAGSVTAMCLVLLLIGVPGAAAVDNGCDFDGDGYDDAVVGAPYEHAGAVRDSGSVIVIYGSADKLTSSNSQVWHQNTAGVADSAEKYDVFGSALACGDFDADGYSDLAIGAPGEGVEIADATGAIHVLYGSMGGLTTNKSDFFHRGTAGIAGQTHVAAAFGGALAAGDFDGDGDDDLAVGVPGDTIGPVSEAGSVQVFEGGPNGLRKGGDKIFHRDKKGVKGDLANFGGFGSSLSAGDFNGDGIHDLAIGSPGDIVDGHGYVGSVNVLYGSDTGLSKSGDDLFDRGVNGVAGQPDALDRFGWAVASGDFDNDGYDELAIAVPFDEVAGVTDAGSVQVMSGSDGGLKKAGDVIWNRNSPGVRAAPSTNERFGYSMTVAQFDAGRHYDLAVGVPRDDVGGESEAGSVQVIYGSSGGLSGAGDQVWHRNKKGIKGSATAGDWLGYSAGSGDFDGDGEDDLLVGVPLSDSAATDAGDIAVLYGTNHGIDAGGDQIWSQDSPGIGGVAESDDQLGRVSTG